MRYLRKLLAAALLGLVIACTMHVRPVQGQVIRYTFRGLRYIFPSTHADGFLRSDGANPANLTWGTGTPTSLILFTKDGVCPSGWTEYTTGRGRYFVGLTSGVTNGTTAGTALVNVENRATGTHTHPASTSVNLSVANHSHGLPSSAHAHGDIWLGAPRDFIGYYAQDDGPDSTTTTNTAFASTGITFESGVTTGVTFSASLTVANAPGAVAGTNAPNIQLMACQKS